MSNASSESMHHQEDALTQYVSSVSQLHSKFGTISANQKDAAASLGRAAQMLRELAEFSRQRLVTDFGK